MSTQPIDEQREVLKALVLEDVTKCGIPMRPMDIWHRICKNPDVMFWGTCLHVGVQLRRLKSDGLVRKVYMEHVHRYGQRWGYWAWVLKDYNRADLEEWRRVVLATGKPLKITDKRGTL